MKLALSLPTKIYLSTTLRPGSILLSNKSYTEKFLVRKEFMGPQVETTYNVLELIEVRSNDKLFRLKLVLDEDGDVTSGSHHSEIPWTPPLVALYYLMRQQKGLCDIPFAEVSQPIDTSDSGV